MKNLPLNVLMAAVASSALMANIAVAHDDGKAGAGNLGDSGKHIVTDSSGNCIRTSSWSKETAVKACNPELFPEPVAAAPMAPPPVAPAPPPVSYETVTLSAGALFDFDKASLKTEGRQQLDDVASKITSNDKIESVRIVGHTDSVGPESYNQQLSLRRATSVRDYLGAKGVDTSLMSISGMGESSPVADNSSRAGRAQNRRVEVTLGVTRRK
jgi:OOP family OmpA-OmpF porin